MLLASCLLAYVAWSAVCLEINVRKARALKIPIVRIPFSMNNNVWMVVQPLVWKVLKCLLPSIPLELLSRFCALFGPVWALVSPGGIHMHFSDPDAIQDILSRWRDFVRPIYKYQMLAVYGPNVFTVELDDWPRHRKAIAAPFNEMTMSLVWGESLKQTKAMLHHWSTKSSGEMTGLSLSGDLKTLSLNVLASSAYGESYDFKGSAEWKRQGSSSATESYRDALYMVQQNLILLMLIPYRLLKVGPWIPAKFRSIAQAAESLKTIMTKVVTEDLVALNQGREGTRGTITSLVRAFEEDESMSDPKESGIEAKRRRKGSLSVSEILGNTFVINVAGLDTTPNTLSYTLMLLAAHPEVQEWLHEEIHDVASDQMSLGPDISDDNGEGTHRPLQHDEKKKESVARCGDYSVLYSRLNRCQAVMLETLRLYPPITGVPKVVMSQGPQTLRIEGGQVLAIPPGVEVFPMFTGVQTDPRYWDDPDAWKPSRWIVKKQQPRQHGVGGEMGEKETLLSPHKGTFYPWSGGPQYCIGKKFSQVEIVAVLACLFHSHRVHVTTRPGETGEQARQRARDCADDVNYDFLLKMNHPERVGLEWVRRGIDAPTRLTVIM
ncbi:cytochrome P450 monooxygenase [Apiospora kogelbergensis]|uniref:cytochrome P450 monooxygenase n=1 Tax=Apiospora kogelbergensis TaxID=1337665 RepID=UPI00312E4EB3